MKGTNVAQKTTSHHLFHLFHLFVSCFFLFCFDCVFTGLLCMFKTCPRQTLLHWKDLEGATVTVSVVRSEELQSCLAETSEAELHEFMSPKLCQQGSAGRGQPWSGSSNTSKDSLLQNSNLGSHSILPSLSTKFKQGGCTTSF